MDFTLCAGILLTIIYVATASLTLVEERCPIISGSRVISIYYSYTRYVCPVHLQLMFIIFRVWGISYGQGLASNLYCFFVSNTYLKYQISFMLGKSCFLWYTFYYTGEWPQFWQNTVKSSVTMSLTCKEVRCL